MSPLIQSLPVQAILTDIEGTTSSIRFVKEVLFPYAAKVLPDFLRSHHQDSTVAPLIADAATEAECSPDDLEGIIQHLLDWIASDRKSTVLKALQGLIWEAGYRDGRYKGHVYADAHQQLQIWFQQGLPLYIYSSGSIQAQKLFFGYSEFGDLTPWFRGYFDTTTGPKREAASYQRIAQAIAQETGAEVENILFLSDVQAELEAAIAAGFQVCWLVRPEDNPVSEWVRSQVPYPTAQSFAEIGVARE